MFSTLDLHISAHTQPQSNILLKTHIKIQEVWFFKKSCVLESDTWYLLSSLHSLNLQTTYEYDKSTSKKKPIMSRSRKHFFSTAIKSLKTKNKCKQAILGNEYLTAQERILIVFCLKNKV